MRSCDADSANQYIPDSNDRSHLYRNYLATDWYFAIHENRYDLGRLNVYTKTFYRLPETVNTILHSISKDYKCFCQPILNVFSISVGFAQFVSFFLKFSLRFLTVQLQSTRCITIPVIPCYFSTHALMGFYEPMFIAHWIWFKAVKF